MAEAAALIAGLNAKRLVFTITAGRTGTALLAALLARSLGIEAEHEPAPRFNFVMRALLDAPDAAASWLMHEKLPAIAARARGPVYAETSHLVCKGFIEPMLALGLRPAFIILTRPADEVAASLHAMGAIPERSTAGRLVLLGPRDPGALAPEGWETFSDFQLCYWYAREIERRQASYETIFRARGIGTMRVTMDSLADWNAFGALASFVSGGAGVSPDRATFDTVIARPQNPQAFTRCLPVDAEPQRAAVDAAIAAELASTG